MNRDPRIVSSRENPLLQRVRKLVQDPVAYRKIGQVWLEGEHLAQALDARGRRALHAVVAESAWSSSTVRKLCELADDVVQVPDRLFAGFSGLPSPAGMGLLCATPSATSLQPAVSTVVLDRLQDPGNLGSVLRTASALGVVQVIALRGTAGLWSPKVLRAAMGAHFALSLIEGQSETALDLLAVPLLATSSHARHSLTELRLPAQAAWVFGHEGQGIAASVLQRCAQTVRIPQPGGEESLNVSASAAICLYESMRQREAQGSGSTQPDPASAQ